MKLMTKTARPAHQEAVNPPPPKTTVVVILSKNSYTVFPPTKQEECQCMSCCLAASLLSFSQWSWSYILVSAAH